MNPVAQEHGAVPGGLALHAAGLPLWLSWDLGLAWASRPRDDASDAPDDAEAADLADRRDVRDSLAGDGDAFARLVRRHQAAVAALMWRFTRDRGQWEELVHDVFVEAFVSLPTFKGRSPLVHWLRRIAVRVGYRWWRRRERDKAIAPLEAGQWAVLRERDAGQAAADEAGQLVHAVLGRLPVRDRLVLTLLYLEGSSVRDAARLTGWSQTMVKVQAHRARKRLRKLLGETEL